MYRHSTLYTTIEVKLYDDRTRSADHGQGPRRRISPIGHRPRNHRFSSGDYLVAQHEDHLENLLRMQVSSVQICAHCSGSGFRKSNWYQPSRRISKKERIEKRTSIQRIHPGKPFRPYPLPNSSSYNLQSHMPNQLNTPLQLLLHIRDLLLQRHVLHPQPLHHRPRRAITT